MSEIKYEDMPERISTNPETDMLIMREIARIVSLERDKRLMAAVAFRLQEVGVDFSKADLNKL